jgi:hypothetical protein
MSREDARDEGQEDPEVQELRRLNLRHARERAGEQIDRKEEIFGFEEVEEMKVMAPP